MYNTDYLLILMGAILINNGVFNLNTIDRTTLCIILCIGPTVAFSLSKLVSLDGIGFG